MNIQDQVRVITQHMNIQDQVRVITQHTPFSFYTGATEIFSLLIFFFSQYKGSGKSYHTAATIFIDQQVDKNVMAGPT